MILFRSFFFRWKNYWKFTKNVEKSTNRRQLDALLDGMSDKGIRIVTATAREITEVEKTEG